MSNQKSIYAFKQSNALDQGKKNPETGLVIMGSEDAPQTTGYPSSAMREVANEVYNRLRTQPPGYYSIRTTPPYDFRAEVRKDNDVDIVRFIALQGSEQNKFWEELYRIVQEKQP